MKLTPLEKWLSMVVAVLAMLAVATKDCKAGVSYRDDPRFCGFVDRDRNGEIKRSDAEIAKFKRIWPCPSTGKKSGPCPKYAINHSVPIACGGCDSIHNMEWMRIDVKRVHDTYERKVYGGHNMSKGCP